MVDDRQSMVPITPKSSVHFNVRSDKTRKHLPNGNASMARLQESVTAQH